MKNQGWSILEILIVSLIISVCAGVGVSSLIGIRAMQTLQSTARILAADLSTLRTRAVSLNRPLSLVVAEDGMSYGLAARATTPERWVGLRSGIRITSSPSHPVTFYSRGNAAPAGSLILTSPRGASVRVIVAPFGRIRWEWLP